MKREDLLREMHREPFRAFTIQMPDGRKLKVLNRASISITRDGGTLVIHSHPDRMDFITVAEIKRIKR